ncbi:hypothetical protein C1H46_034078 [Malus baccata]|uniref:PIGA GPI anchor biosynthesis domain-containing protein n=1 Tax=Malus baccata TaxID=106549 RepID=A0A540L247_MALBA|nr:hypothetical protein C1H46_034078 [Malus baccata]
MTGGLKVYYVPWKPFLMQNTFPTFYGTPPIVRTILIREKISLKKVFVIPNAVDTAMFKPAPERLSSHEIVIVVISRLVYLRGADLLVEVMPEVCRLYPNVLVNLFFLPLLSRTGEHYLTEAFCIAILEAASCGLLTVSTRVGGVPEVLPDDMIVFAKPDPSDMVQAIEKAISILPRIDPQEMHSRELYNWHDVAKRTEIVYDRALKCSNQNLLQRLSRYLSCGTWAGNIFCLVMIIDFLLWHLLQLWKLPAEDIEEVPDFVLSHDQDEGTSLENANQRSR